MTKKLIGIIVATAVIVIIVIAAIRRDNFQSMVLRDEIEDQTYPEPVRHNSLRRQSPLKRRRRIPYPSK